MLLDRDEENIRKVKEMVEHIVENGFLLSGSKSYFVVKLDKKKKEINFRVDFYDKKKLYKITSTFKDDNVRFFAMYSEGEMYKSEEWYQLHEAHGILFSDKYPSLTLTI